MLMLIYVGCIQTTKENKAPLSATTEKIAISDSKEASVVYRSTDNGITWFDYASGMPPQATVSSFLGLGNAIYAATDNHGIYTINDVATKWVRLDIDLPEGVDINAITIANDFFIIGTFRQGIFISENGGINWRKPVVPIEKNPIRCLLANKNRVLAGTDAGIYYSPNNGNTWIQSYKEVQINGFTTVNNKLYAAARDGALMSEDDGMTWRYIYKPLTLHDISNDGESVYAMTLGGGLLKSKNDGLTWENANSGLGATNLYTFEVKNMGSKLLAAQWYGVYQSTDAGKNWEIIKKGMPDSTAFTTLEVTGLGIVAGIGLRSK